MFTAVSLKLSLCLAVSNVVVNAPSLPVLQEYWGAGEVYCQCCRLSQIRDSNYLGAPRALDKYIEELKSQRRLASLEMIVLMQCPGHSAAAKAYVAVAPSAKAIQFVRLLPSIDYRSAFEELGYHPKADVIPFLRDLFSSKHFTDDRAQVYLLAMNHGWSDFLDEAWIDVKRTERVFLYPRELGDMHIAELAHDYLRMFEKSRPIPARPVFEEPPSLPAVDIP